MRLGPTAEQERFRQAVRDLLDKECPPEVVRAAWADPAGRLPRAWAALAEQGVLGAVLPEPLGGLGLGVGELLPVLVETGRAALPGPLPDLLAAAGLLSEVAPLDPAADRLAAGLLPRVAEGAALVAARLPGLPFVAHADLAELVLLADDETLRAVRPDQAGLLRQPSVDGTRRLFSVRAEPAVGDRLATGPAVTRAVARAFDRGVLAAAAQLVGAARQLIDLSARYARQREQFGRPIGAFQALKHQLADALVAVEFAEPVLLRAGYTFDRVGGTAGRDVSMAKLYADAAAGRAARVALQVHGAIGYTMEHDLQLWLKRVWALTAGWGTAAWHRDRVAAEVLSGAATRVP